jgi:hypothetical protein
MLSLAWPVVSGIPLMLLAESWEMWWNPFARDTSSSDDRRVVKRAFGVAG